MLRGADASSSTDVASLATKWGLSFMFFRCQRQFGQLDDAFVKNMQQARALYPKFVGGGYEFALPDFLPDPAERARTSWQYFTSAGPLKPSDLYCLDLEQSPVGQDETNAWAKAWYDEWSRVADRPPGLYGGSAYLLSRTFAGLKEYGFNWLWFPRYPSSSLTWPTIFNPQLLGGTWPESNWHELPEFWQFYGGTMYDFNLFNGTLAELQTLNERGQDVIIGLTKGDQGNAVKELQSQLMLAGFYSGSVDGVYDTELSASVLACRKSMGSAVTSGDTIDHYAYRQIFVAVLRAKAGEGPKGDKGDTGDSAYQVAVKNGFIGTEAEWLESLEGQKGDKGDRGDEGKTPTSVTINLTADVTGYEGE